MLSSGIEQIATTLRRSGDFEVPMSANSLVSPEPSIPISVSSPDYREEISNSSIDDLSRPDVLSLEPLPEHEVLHVSSFMSCFRTSSWVCSGVGSMLVSSFVCILFCMSLNAC